MTAQAIDIRNENLLKRNRTFFHKNDSNYDGAVLVTGPNSFIGCHVVKQLDEKYPGKVHLVVRAPSDAEAVIKMQQAYNQWNLGHFNADRFIFHRGDVCKNLMGLHPDEFKVLRNNISQVIHLAMTPMYHLPYHHFQRIWIPELDRMIDFCGDPNHPKFLHYASSFNANFFQSDEDFRALNTNAWQSGYAGFKWVAGQALKRAINKGLGACIYDIPLVLGSEKEGVCPAHYSIWLILDIFLKTGLFFPFRFNIIPVDILADIIVYNVLQVRELKASAFLRPMLDEPVTDRLFARTAANLLGLKESRLPEVREACYNKLRFDFMMPGNFYELMDKVIGLKSVFPEGYHQDKLPTATMVFISNLNSIMLVKQDVTLE
jgi:thioester reductase-like protein